ncbi:terpenoid cyclases/protein prenyltransferase alpha-alpha toroid [Powellomyces hirtus]|nr:terpenoid cyclases/protein prenyltransferase alpha-alpha toroid [Powellomyces hirtus]
MAQEVPSKFLLDLHVQFILGLDKKKDEFEYWASEQLRLNGVYWALTSLDLMNHKDDLNRDDVIAFVLSCQNKDGGFGGSVEHDSHLIYTLSAVQIMVMLDAVDRLDRSAITAFIQSRANPDGSFTGDAWGEVDTRFSYIALAALSLLDRLDAVNVPMAVRFIEACRNFDGGFGSTPGAESHAGQIFCCVGALAIVDALEIVEADKLGWWLAERQLKNGGLNGRPEKLEDVCYSWWVLSALSILDRIHWINKDSLIQFILGSQDAETGGIADRPGDYPDVFHMLFGVAGLALLGYPGLKPVDPRYCMPKYVTDQIPNRRNIQSREASS